MICTTFSTPSTKISSKSSSKKFASFTLSNASTDYKNIVPCRQEARKFIMVWFFPSLHPSDIIVHTVLAHDLQLFKYSSMDASYFYKRGPLKSCILGPLKPLPATTMESNIG